MKQLNIGSMGLFALMHTNYLKKKRQQTSMKNNYGFVLIQPQLGENIGATARSLKNFGFKNLIITNPKCSWPNIKAKATSVGAFDIISSTKVFKNTNTAI